jgi:TetR/AcrR family transcriptional regulator
MNSILDSIEGVPLVGETRQAFIEQFVDFLLQYQREVDLFINQGPALEDVPVVDRANLLVVKLSMFFSTAVSTVEDHLRFGVALGGAAYVLSAKKDTSLPELPVDEVRAALVTIVSELLAPISIRKASK